MIFGDSSIYPTRTSLTALTALVHTIPTMALGIDTASGPMIVADDPAFAPTVSSCQWRAAHIAYLAGYWPDGRTRVRSWQSLGPFAEWVNGDVIRWRDTAGRRWSFCTRLPPTAVQRLLTAVPTTADPGVRVQPDPALGVCVVTIDDASPATDQVLESLAVDAARLCRAEPTDRAASPRPIDDRPSSRLRRQS